MIWKRFPSLSLCEGNQTVTGGSCGRGQVTQSYNVSLDLYPSKLMNKLSNCRWFETWSLCDFTLLNAELVNIITNSHVHHSVKFLCISFNCNGNIVVTTSFTKLILATMGCNYARRIFSTKQIVSMIYTCDITWSITYWQKFTKATLWIEHVWIITS